MSDKGGTGYEHFVSEHPVDVTAFSKLIKHLCNTEEDLQRVYEENKDSKYIAFDTETDGLNADINQIVGFSFAFSPREGWYVPVRHKLGKNVEPKFAFDILYKMLMCRQVFLYNMRFDTRMLEKEGYDLSKMKYYDVQVGVYLADTNWKKTGLKGAERRWLGWPADTFTETLGSASDFSYLDPEEGCYEYACVDAIGTFAVCQKTVCYYQEAKIAGRVINEELYHLMKCEDTWIDLDLEYYEKCELDALERLKELEHNIMTMIGYPIKLNSNKQLGDALQSLGINTGYFTKGGQMKVDLASLETCNLKDPHPILPMLCEYSRLFKEYNSYITPFIKQCREFNNKARFNFKHCVAPTARIAAGGDKGNAYFAPINVMALPKPHPKNWYVHPWTSEEDMKPGDQHIYKWRMSLTDPSPIMTEGQDPHSNMRYGMVVPEGRIGISMDYAAQELRFQANIAHVQNWCDTFNSGGDLHKNMATSMWGAENYDKSKRKMAKALNFGNLYGMSPYTLAEREHISLEEAEDICNRWWAAVPEIRAFQDYQLRVARKTGTQYNFFGFPRRLRYYLNSSDSKKRGFGKRTIGNNPIQSGCAIMTQASLISVCSKLYENPDWKDDCSFFTFVHDEIDSSVSIDRMIEFINIQHDCQTKKFPNMPVTFETSCALFNRFGTQYETDFVIVDDPEWKFGRVVDLEIQSFPNPRWSESLGRELTDEEIAEQNKQVEEHEVEEVDDLYDINGFLDDEEVM